MLGEDNRAAKVEGWMRTGTGRGGVLMDLERLEVESTPPKLKRLAYLSKKGLSDGKSRNAT